jgi:hypothetical protein
MYHEVVRIELLGGIAANNIEIFYENPESGIA